MHRILLTFILGTEIFALYNRGGGPLLAHLFLTGVTFLVAFFLLYRQTRTKEPVRLDLPELFYLGFVAIFIISLFFSRTPEFGLSELLLFSNTGLLFILFRHQHFTPRDINYFTGGVIAIAVVDTLIGYFFYLTHAFPRLAGSFIDLKDAHTSFANDYANFLLLVLPLAFYHLFKKTPRITHTLITILATAILVSGLLLSFSRAAWIGFLGMAAVGVVWLALRPDPEFVSAGRRVMRTAAVVLVVSFCVYSLQNVRGELFEVTPLVKKLSFQADEGGASASERVAFWQGALEIIKERPLLGSGVLSFKYLHPAHQDVFEVNWDHPHSIFLKVAVENGLIAMTLFMAFLIVSAWRLTQFFWRHPGHMVFPFALGALGALVHNFVDFNFIVSNYTLFIVFLGLALSYVPFERPVFSSRRVVAVASLASFFLLILGLHEGFYNVDFKRGRAALVEKDYVAAASYLEQAAPLIFDRDRAVYLLRAYEKQFEVSKEKIWEEKKEALVQAAPADTVYADLVAEKGEIAQARGDLAAAEKFFARAIELDPMNTFSYYYQFFSVQKAQKKPLDANLEARAKNLLSFYQTALRGNKHFTALGENPLYAERLYRLFGMDAEANLIYQLGFSELIKFAQKYGS